MNLIGSEIYRKRIIGSEFIGNEIIGKRTEPVLSIKKA